MAGVGAARVRVLVTGSEGYIGSVLVPFLTHVGHEVVGLDTGYFAECVVGATPNSGELVAQDVRDVVLDESSGFDAVIHLAALANDPLGDLNAGWTYEINHLSTVRLARAAKRCGVRRFLFASSCSLYGVSGSDQEVAEDAELKPLTPYAESKVRAERELLELASDSFSPVSLRNATVYGFSPRFRSDIVVNNLVCWGLTTGQIQLLSDGLSWRPLIHVEDLARACDAILHAPRNAVHGEAFNVGVPGENYQVRSLATIVGEALPHTQVRFADGAGPDRRSYRVDFSKLAVRVPDFTPRWNVRRGAEQVVACLKDAGITREDFEGGRYARLDRLKDLLARGELDDTLRWNSTRARSSL